MVVDSDVPLAREPTPTPASYAKIIGTKPSLKPSGANPAPSPVDKPLNEAEDGFTTVTHKKRKLNARDSDAPSKAPSADLGASPALTRSAAQTKLSLAASMKEEARSKTGLHRPLPQTVSSQPAPQLNGRTVQPPAGWPKHVEFGPVPFFQNVTDDTRAAWLNSEGPCCRVAVNGQRADESDPNIQETMGRLQIGIIAVVGNDDFVISPPVGAGPPDESGAPNWFLITSPREENIARLLAESTHSLLEPFVTFHTKQVEYEIDTFIGTFKGFSPTIKEESAKQIIEEHLRNTVLPDILMTISQTPVSWDDFDEAINRILESLTVQVIPWKLGGDIPAPLVNVYLSTTAESISEWYGWRDAIVTHVYTSAKHGTGRGTTPPHCKGCHGADHPQGLCPFTSIPGWNGSSSRSNFERGSSHGRNGRDAPNKGGRGRGGRGGRGTYGRY